VRTVGPTCPSVDSLDAWCRIGDLDCVPFGLHAMPFEFRAYRVSGWAGGLVVMDMD